MLDTSATWNDLLARKDHLQSSSRWYRPKSGITRAINSHRRPKDPMRDPSVPTRDGTVPLLYTPGSRCLQAARGQVPPSGGIAGDGGSTGGPMGAKPLRFATLRNARERSSVVLDGDIFVRTESVAPLLRRGDVIASFSEGIGRPARTVAGSDVPCETLPFI